jgi:hypothetical protein
MKIGLFSEKPGITDNIGDDMGNASRDSECKAVIFIGGY